MSENMKLILDLEEIKDYFYQQWQHPTMNESKTNHKLEPEHSCEVWKHPYIFSHADSDIRQIISLFIFIYLFIYLLNY